MPHHAFENFLSAHTNRTIFSIFTVHFGTVFSCPDGQFRCTDGLCLDPKQKCDGYADCNDGSDERDCISNTSRSKMKLLCLKLVEIYQLTTVDLIPAICNLNGFQREISIYRYYVTSSPTFTDAVRKKIQCQKLELWK